MIDYEGKLKDMQDKMNEYYAKIENGEITDYNPDDMIIMPDYFDEAANTMAEMLGVSDITEFMSLSNAEQNKRSKAMNDSLFEMMGITEEEALQMDRDMRNAHKKSADNFDIHVPENVAERLKPFIRNAIYIEPVNEEVTINSDISKIGGKPVLPENFEWVRNEFNKALTFIMQINCAEIYEYDKDNIFPQNGMLYFFYDVENQLWDSGDDGNLIYYKCDNADNQPQDNKNPNGKGFAVYYYDGDLDVLVPTDFPDDYDIDDCCFYNYAELNCIIDERAVKFFSKDDLPSHDDYCELCHDAVIDFDYDEAKDALLGYSTYDYSENYFKLGGYSYNQQNGIIKEFGNDYTQLCQISTFDSGECGFMFGDGGCLYFYIKKDEFADRQFENVKFTLQCY